MMKLNEGKEYEFFVEKELTLPDNSTHFLLKGPDSKKYLIPALRYNHYGIIIGSYIKCRVDKINCKGDLFLEPENPWYSVGKSYSFPVAGVEVRTDRSGIKHTVVVVTDITGNKIPVVHDPSIPLPEEDKVLSLMVEKITKGKVHLAQPSRIVKNKSLRAGKRYEFIMDRIEKGMDNKEYFVIKDPFGSFHTIRREYYEYYGFSEGSRFLGKVLRGKKGGDKIIEPENPFYKSGSIIKLKITGSVRNIINPSFTLNLRDKFGFTHIVEAAAIPKTKSVRCRIVMVKKGKPLLEVL